MEVTNHRTESKVTHSWSLNDGPTVRVNAYSHTGKRMIVERVHAVWYDGAGPNLIKASGRLLKKDGTYSQNVGKSDYYLYEQKYIGRADPAPEWLIELLMKYGVLRAVPGSPRDVNPYAPLANDEEQA